MNNFKKKIVIDSIINIISVTIPIATLQILVLPEIAQKTGETNYGLIVTLISLITLFSESYGNVLNNTRLLEDNNYKYRQQKGDFNILLIYGILINTVLVVVGTLYYQKNYMTLVMVIIVANLTLVRAYAIVAFRLSLNYAKLLINNILLASGYVIGLWLFNRGGHWGIVYLSGTFISLIYIFKNSDLLYEPINKTALYSNTKNKCIVLFLADVMKTALNYADKLIIFPVLGAEAVTIYYSANIIGKMISMAINPISSVILSYLTKAKTLSKKNLTYIMIFLCFSAVIGFILCMFLGRWLLYYLYPGWASRSLELLPITTLSTLILALSSLLHPIVLRFRNEKDQLIINGLNLIIYGIAVVIMVPTWGLKGFCYSYLVTCSLKFIILVWLSLRIPTINSQ